jgi:hypothetical protein
MDESGSGYCQSIISPLPLSDLFETFSGLSFSGLSFPGFVFGFIVFGFAVFGVIVLGFFHQASIGISPDRGLSL